MKILLTIVFIIMVCSCSNSQNNQENLQKLYPQKNAPIKYQQDWQIDFYYKKIEEFRDSPIGFNKIVFLGNSITEAGGDWNKKFGVANIVNRGISGDITEGVLNRLDEIIYYKPIAVFLLIGINDIFNADIPDRENITPEYVSNNILKIATRIVEQSPSTEIFIQTILPINDETYTTNQGWFPKHTVPLPLQINSINNLLKEKCKNKVFNFIDLHSAFINEKELLNESFTTDGVHLSDNGYQAWVSFIKNELDSLPKVEK